MIRIFEDIALDFIEEEILFCWGSADYFETLKTLTTISKFATNNDLKEKIFSLSRKLLLYCYPSEYPEKYSQVCAELNKGMKSKLKWAKELLDFQCKPSSAPLANLKESLNHTIVYDMLKK